MSASQHEVLEADQYAVESEAALEEIYPRAKKAVKNAWPGLHEFHVAYLRVARMVLVGSAGPEGFDVSPRGGEPGFVRPLDARTLAIPDFPGNNKIETLRNIVRDGRVGLLFLFPGLEVFMRINGHARVRRDPALLEMLACEGKRPIVAIVVDVQATYFHCGRAINRSHIWDASLHLRRESLPSVGEVVRTLSPHLTQLSAEELDAIVVKASRTALYDDPNSADLLRKPVEEPLKPAKEDD